MDTETFEFPQNLVFSVNGLVYYNKAWLWLTNDKNNVIGISKYILNKSLTIGMPVFNHEFLVNYIESYDKSFENSFLDNLFLEKYYLTFLTILLDGYVYRLIYLLLFLSCILNSNLLVSLSIPFNYWSIHNFAFIHT